MEVVQNCQCQAASSGFRHKVNFKKTHNSAASYILQKGIQNSSFLLR